MKIKYNQKKDAHYLETNEEDPDSKLNVTCA